MKTLRFIFLTAAAALISLPIAAQDFEAYSLPLTVVNVDVDCEHEIFEAGKYAPWAKDLLGIDVEQKNSVKTHIRNLSIYPSTENDRSAVNWADVSGEGRVAFSTLMDNGFITKISPYSARSSYNVSGDMEVSGQKGNGKTLQAEARKAAEQIRTYREQKYNILIGNTDASYTGEALGDAVREFNRLEEELLIQFKGTKRTVSQSLSFQLVPTDEGIYPVLEYVEGKGLVPASGKGSADYKIRISAEKPEVSGNGAEQNPNQGKKGKKVQKLVYRIPAICTISMSEGSNEILRTRMPISQLGITSEYYFYNN